MDSEFIDIKGLLKRTMDDKEIAKEVLQCYMQETPDILSKLRQAIEIKDFKDSRERSHEIKGSSASVGALKMHKISEIMQRESEKSNIEMLETLIEKLLKTYTETEKIINKLDLMK